MSRAQRRTHQREVAAHARAHFGPFLEEVRRGDPRTAANMEWPPHLERVWVSERFIAQLYDVHHAPGWKRLSIKRHDDREMQGWDLLHRIKNETVGPEARAVEMYPPALAVVDVANMRHLWIPPAGVLFPDLGRR